MNSSGRSYNYVLVADTSGSLMDHGEVSLTQGVAMISTQSYSASGVYQEHEGESLSFPFKEYNAFGFSWL